MTDAIIIGQGSDILKNKFALSFGIALIAIGLMNFIFDTNYVILFGISLSAFIFSLLNILFNTKLEDKKWESMYIIPLIIMLTFLCYGNELLKFKIFSLIINDKITSALTFISFGLTFVSDFIMEKRFAMHERVKHYSIAIESLEYSTLILTILNKFMKTLIVSKKSVDKDTQKLLDEIENLSKEQAKKLRLKVNY